MDEKRLKIAIFIDVYFPMVDGVVVVVDNYARRLSRFADVTVYCPKCADKSFKDEFPYRVVRCKSIASRRHDYPIGLPLLDRAFKRQLKKERYDIVHIHSPFYVSRLGVKYARKRGIPVVATMHSQYKRDFLRATGSKFIANRLLHSIMRVFNRCDECWTVNSACKQIFTEEYGLKVPCLIRNNATDLLPTDASLAEKWAQDALGIAADERVLLFSGRLIALKNILFIADSLKYVREAGVKFRMVFLGKGPDEDKLKKRLEKNGVADACMFAGRIMDRTHLSYLYNRADLFLFPSLYDASSLVQIEAASQGTPTVFLRGSATSSTATEDVNGIFSEDDARDFAKHIVHALTDGEYLKRLGEGAFRDLYRTWDEAVAESYARYLELIAAKKQSAK